MKKVSVGMLSLVLLICAMPTLAKDPLLKIVDSSKSVSTASTAAPDSASSQPCYQSPKDVVRQMAEYRTSARMQRLNSSKWFGISNQRPTKSVDAINSDASPTWTSNNALFPYRWQATAALPVVIVR